MYILNGFSGIPRCYRRSMHKLVIRKIANIVVWAHFLMLKNLIAKDNCCL